MDNEVPGTKRNRCDDVPAHQLTSDEITLKSLRFLDKRKVPCDAVVFKQGQRHYAIHNGEKTKVFLPKSLSQKSYQYYNRMDITETSKVFGGGTKHHKSYIVEDDKKIAVFSKTSLSKFHLAFNDGQFIDPQITVYLDESNKLYIEDDGQKEFLTQVRRQPCNRKKMSSVQESGIPTHGGSLESQPMSLSTLGMFAPNRWSSQAPNSSSMQSKIPVSSEGVFLGDFASGFDIDINSGFDIDINSGFDIETIYYV